MSKTISQLTDSGGIDIANDLFVVRRDTGTPQDFKVAFVDLAEAVRALPIVGITYDVTIASGVITVDPLHSPIAAYHLVDTEAAASTDDLNTIVGTKQGQLLTLQLKDNARDVVVKDGIGNIFLTSGDFTLTNIKDAMQLVYNLSLNGWCEIRRSDNA